MRQRRDRLLNGLLVCLVVSSLLLSIRLFFPPDEVPLLGDGGGSVEVPVPEWQAQMPDVYRPERIYVQLEPGQAALVALGSEPYDSLWTTLQAAMTGMEPDWSHLSDETEQAVVPGITLALPAPFTAAEWAEVWGWNPPPVAVGSMKIDRVRFDLGTSGAIMLAGPAGAAYAIGVLTPEQLADLQALAAELPEDLLVAQRPLELASGQYRVLPGLTVPAINAVPWARISVLNPELRREGNRYFPDPSVVRQIDEKDAQSLTDGQRLLRLASSGVLEYRTAGFSGSAPDLEKAQELVGRWVGTRGGWPSEIVLTGYRQQDGAAILRYEVRLPGPLPVETAGGALEIQLIAGSRAGQPDTVVAMRRYPQLLPAFDTKVALPVILPEEALTEAEKDFPSALLFETVRDLYLAYLVLPGSEPGDVAWQIEPVWVIQAGESRIYIPALTGAHFQPLQADAAGNSSG